MDRRRTRLAIVAGVVAGGLTAPQAGAQSLDLSYVDDAGAWSAGCGTDEFGTNFCAVQKSTGPQALGYVLQQRAEGFARQVRIAVSSVIIDAESPVTIQIDENEPLVWTVGYKIIDSHVISLNGETIDSLVQELENGDMVMVTLYQKTGDPITFELALEGFTEAVQALEDAQSEAIE